MKNFSDIRTAVIGVGSMGQNHARIYSELSNLVGVADPNEEQGRMVSKRFGAKWYSDYKQMLGDVDAVSIAVPTIHHLEVSKEVAEAGVHMLVEKPLSSSKIDAERIIQYADSSDVVLAVGHIERHNPIVKKAKKSIISGEWGEIITSTARRFSNYPNRITDVGVLFDLTIHDLDVIRHLIGDEIDSVFATGGNLRNDNFEDHVNVLLKFSKGKIGLCETNWLTPMKVRNLAITTTSHYIVLDYLKQEIRTHKSRFGKIDEHNLYKPPIEYDTEIIKLESEEPLRNELMDFLTSVRGEKLPLVDGYEGLQAVIAVSAAVKSLSIGEVVKNIEC